MRIPLLSGALTAASILAAVVAVAVLHPDTPLPREWNPREPLLVSDPYSPMTRWKLRRASGSLAQCLAALDTSDALALPGLDLSGDCGITQRVTVGRVGAAAMSPLETDCRIALRLALWERHDLQEVSAEILGASVTRIEHFSSFSCRKMRTASGVSSRWSTHATGQAVDVSGFELSDGTRIDLRADWSGRAEKAEFLRKAQQSACRWFGGVLGPAFNSLHADHFHMQVEGRGFCR